MKQTNFFLFPFLVLFLFSCNKEEHYDAVSNRTDKNFVDSKQAVAIASLIGSPPETNGLRSTNAAKLEIESIVPFGDNEQPSFYIVNYKDNKGYVMLSADKRVDAVMAFSTSDNFVIEDDPDLPSGLVDWMYNADDVIEEVRLTDGAGIELETEANQAKINQDLILMVQQSFYQEPDDHLPTTPDPCAPWTIKNGPLMTTTWGQGPGYNDFVPKTGCSTYSNGRAPAGCVAVAMAQLMKYHRYPVHYNWSAMPDEEGSPATASLIYRTGKSVDMTYGCDGSGAYSEDIPNAFKQTFGYRSASIADYTTSNFKTVVKEINQGYPVILSGGRRSNGLLPQYRDGHSWVCDGYWETQGCPEEGDSYVVLYFWMNWGWGRKYNGWYGFQKWDLEDGSSFNYKPKMIYNIRP